jgi:predicted ArsR family transcriptional regulator
MKAKLLIAAHPVQARIVEVVANRGIDDLTLRALGQAIGIASASPQQIKHHLQQLVRYGFLDIVSGKYRIGRVLKSQGKASR